MLQASEIVLYILVTFCFGLTVGLIPVIYFVCSRFESRFKVLSDELSVSQIEALDHKSELSLKYDEQLAALAKGHNDLVAQMNDLSGKIASLNATVQGGRLNGTKTSQANTVPSIFPGRF